MAQSKTLLRAARWLHLYLGTFTAPALLFFAFTGALQTFNLHEASHEPGQGSSYKPPAWIASLAQIHKHQTPETPAHRAKPEAGAAGHDSHDDHDDDHHGGHHDAAPSSQGNGAPALQQASQQKTHLPMKIFFLIVSIGLFLSTLTGIYMSYKYNRNKLAVTALLIAGVAIPLLLLRF